MIVGILGFLLLSAIVERIAFRQYEPNKRALAVVGTAWAITTIAQFVFLPLDTAMMGALLSLFTALAVLLWYRHRYHSQWIDE